MGVLRVSFSLFFAGNFDSFKSFSLVIGNISLANMSVLSIYKPTPPNLLSLLFMYSRQESFIKFIIENLLI